MKKLLIVPAIIAMTAFSGSAFAQRTQVNVGTSTQGANTAVASPVANVASGQIQQNNSAQGNASFLTLGNSQNNSNSQATLGLSGIGSNNGMLTTSR